jgi:hypothetical protein
MSGHVGTFKGVVAPILGLALAAYDVSRWGAHRGLGGAIVIRSRLTRCLTYPSKDGQLAGPAGSCPKRPNPSGPHRCG